MSNVGAWAPLYTDQEPFPYLIDGSDRTYRLGAELLAGMDVVDLGCGTGWFKTLHDGGYVGVDGTASVGADIVADLASYRCPTPGVFMRHVLEHDERWAAILGNALASATRRLVIVLYTPLQDKTRLIQMTGLGAVVELGFALPDLTDITGPVQLLTVGSETVLVVDRPSVADYINQVEGIEKKRYLELGTYDGFTFDDVRAKVKVGVDMDPLAEANYHLTTDEFFAVHSEFADDPHSFDVVLIDADHHFEQVLKDFDNACRALSPGGVIFVHDLVPPDETYATPEPTREDGGWCGDGFRLLALARKAGVEFTVLDEPFGLTRFDDPRPLG